MDVSPKHNNNDKARRFVIGDVHGCLCTLKALIGKLSLLPSDSFYFLGDYIDKGKWSKETIDYLIDFSSHYKTVFLKGNHEEMYEIHSSDPYGLKDDNGNFLPEYDRFWKGLRYYIELEDCFLVHASINFKNKNLLMDKKSMLWKAHKSMYDTKYCKKRIIRGHSSKTIAHIEEKVKNKSKVIPIDNDPSSNSKDFQYLCCLELNTLKLIKNRFLD